MTHTFGVSVRRTVKNIDFRLDAVCKSQENNSFITATRRTVSGKCSLCGAGEAVPASIEDKKAFAAEKSCRAVQDVIEACDIIGSSDSSIRNVRGNDMRLILDAAKIDAVYLNGGKAYELFIKYCRPAIKEMEPPLVKLPLDKSGECGMDARPADSGMAGCICNK